MRVCLTWSKLDDKLGPSWTTRYHQTSTLVSIRASVLTWMDVRGCISSFIRLALHRMSSGVTRVIKLELTKSDRGLVSV